MFFAGVTSPVFVYALVLQCFYRCHLAKVHLRKMKGIARCRRKKRYLAAMKIQNFVRYRAAIKLRADLQLQSDARNNAILVLQSYWRRIHAIKMYNGLKLKHRKSTATTKIQAFESYLNPT